MTEVLVRHREQKFTGPGGRSSAEGLLDNLLAMLSDMILDERRAHLVVS